MGSMDRDYMRASERKKTFTPRPTSPVVGWLIKISLFTVILYLGFKFAHQLDAQKRPPAKPVKEAMVPITIAPAVPAPIPKPAQQTIIYPQVQGIPAQTNVVTKCIVQGKVTYSDVGCPSGAVTKNIATTNNQNLMVAVTAPVSAQVTGPSQALPISAQVNPGPDYAATKAECTALDLQIKSLDSMARQPQSGQTQDWIRGERAKARDRQFRLRCA